MTCHRTKGTTKDLPNAAFSGSGHIMDDAGTYIHWNTSVPHVFFSWWTATTVGAFWLSVLLLFVVSFLYEYLAYYRAWIQAQVEQDLKILAIDPETCTVPERQASDRCNASEGNPFITASQGGTRLRPRFSTCLYRYSWIANILVSLLYGFQVFIAYFLMMVFMTFNGFFISAIIGGLAVGHFGVSLLKHERSSFSFGPVATYETPCH